MPVKRPRNDGCQTETSDPAPIRLSVRALAEFACEGGDLDTGGSLSRMLEGSIAHRRIQASYGEGWRSEYPLRRVLTAPEISIELYGRCDGLYLHGDEAVVEEIKSTLGDVSLMTGEEYPAHWAQAQIYAAMLAEDEGLSAVTVRLRYVCLTGGEEIFTRRRTCQELRRLLEGYIAPMRNWLVRLFQRQNAVRESVKEMGFPFESFRPGQRRLSANVYVAMRDGRNLLCQAPTGTGKTAAVLFAALKALGEGLIERVFYLTARSTGRQAVLDALELMRRHGLDVRAVTVTAKDEICPFEKRDCRPEVCALAKGYYDRRRSAIEEALSAQIMDMQAITDLASKYSICPFELSLDVSENCDVVICDYNYAFDPRVRLQRFFMRKSMSGLLVDEAHNLCQRTRDMLSASLYSKPIAELRRCIGREWGRKAALYRASTRVIRSMEDCCQSEREQTSSPNAPDSLLEAVRDFVIEAKSAFDQPLACHAQLSDRMFECIDFLNAGERYDERMCTLFERQGQSNYGVTLYCADPSAHIAATLQKVRGAALFSATVTPMPFYRDILGLDGEKDALLDIPSPFDPANQLTLRYPLPMR
ncbi:MAG: hypothetical protein IJJ23_09875 [Clostridia bacterium]|nr:hypothetical protein [Clostridia bacterium]